MSNTKRNRSPRQKKILVGEVGVDSGLIWVGDPCYIIHSKHGTPGYIGKNWGEFCSMMSESCPPQMRQFKYALGHACFGVCATSGYGDGYYPVYAYINKENMITKLEINFIDASED